MIGITHTEILCGKATIVKVEGPLNGQTSFDFEEYVNQLIKKEIFFILFDAKDLDYVSSEGIGVLLLVQQKISELNGYLVFFHLSEELDSFFTILGFEKIFKIADSRIQAIQIMDRQIELREMGSSLSGEQEVAYNMHTKQLQLDSFDSVKNKDIGKKDDNRIIEAYISDTNGDKTQIKIKQSNKDEQSTQEIFKKDDDKEILNFENSTPISSKDNEIEQCELYSTSSDIINKDVTQSEKREEQLHYNIDSSTSLFFQPLIIECKKCKSLVRIKAAGEYLCPDCRTVFSVSEDHSVVFDLLN